ncbi:hypothetical protein ACJ73_04893 [Blastomyces percursus]|uniref:Uncharacterized protein n=1 Tax=Blastomyces percursus TaxID=1658174 RepID=A0A1J9R5H9_9EURO|nr:hypothetical protein ACJ73_04893 [Blastomyces percursus]
MGEDTRAKHQGQGSGGGSGGGKLGHVFEDDQAVRRGTSVQSVAAGYLQGRVCSMSVRFSPYAMRAPEVWQGQASPALNWKRFLLWRMSCERPSAVHVLASKEFLALEAVVWPLLGLLHHDDDDDDDDDSPIYESSLSVEELSELV